jgi:multiple sugar transport system permease protein
VPFAAAIVLNELRHCRAYLRFIVYLPVMLPPAVGVLLFKWFYDPGSGLFNQALGVAGLGPLAWLDSTDTALLSLVIVSTWMNLGTGTLIYLAALQSIPGELYEAAELDGAGLFRRIWHVTIPQTRLILMVMLLLQIVATMQVFIEPYLLTGGGPEDATITVAYLMYQYAFNFGDFGGGGALGLMLMIVLLVFSAFYLRLSRDDKSEAVK